MPVFTLLASSKIAISAAALGALTLGGVGTAAYTGSLPTDAQRVAHEVIGAPAPQAVRGVQEAAHIAANQARDEAGEASAAGSAGAAKATSQAKDAAKAAEAAAPKASSAAGAADLDIVGLCHAKAQGGLDAASTGYRTLVLAANGESNVAAFCQSNGASASVQGSTGIDGTVRQAVPGTPNLPSVPAVPGEGALPATPAVPTTLPTAVPTVPSAAVPTDVAQAVRP